MAEDRNLLQKIIKPTDEESDKLQGIKDVGDKSMRILRDEGYINLQLRIIAEKALQEGASSEDIKRKMSEARQKFINDPTPMVRTLNFLYPGKGSRFRLEDEKREFDYEKQQDSKNSFSLGWDPNSLIYTMHVFDYPKTMRPKKKLYWMQDLEEVVRQKLNKTIYLVPFIFAVVEIT